MVFGTLRVEQAAVKGILYGLGVAQIYLGCGILNTIHIHTDTTSITAYQLQNIFTQPRVCAVQTNQRCLTHRQVQQNFLRGHLNIFSKLSVTGGQERTAPWREGESNIGRRIYLTGKLGQRLRHLSPKNHGTNIVQESGAAQKLSQLFGNIFGGGEHHRLSYLSRYGLYHITPRFEGRIEPFSLGPGLNRNIVTLKNGDAVQPQIGEVRGIARGRPQRLGDGRILPGGR